MGKSERLKVVKKQAKNAKTTKLADNADKVAATGRKRTRSGKIEFEEDPSKIIKKTKKKNTTEKGEQKEATAVHQPGNSGKTSIKSGDTNNNAQLADKSDPKVQNELVRTRSKANGKSKVTNDGIAKPSKAVQQTKQIDKSDKTVTDSGGEILPSNNEQPKGDGVQLHVNAGDDNLDDDRDDETGSSSEGEVSSGSESDHELESEDDDGSEEEFRTKKAKLNSWKDDPDFMEIVDAIVEKRQASTKKQGSSSAKSGRRSAGNDPKLQPIKSPSTGTMYVPMLSRVDEFRTPERPSPIPITQRIKNIQLNSDDHQDSEASDQAESDRENGERRGDKNRGPNEEEQSYADQAILAAEQFKATVAAPENRGMPPGKYVIDDMPDHFIQSALHLDEAIKVKIRAGKYVELEKLLPKDKPLKHVRKEPKYEMVNRGGWNYWAPVEDKNQTIHNFAKWEQAFRVYATIYTQANPLRSAEILRYIETINNAALTFVWENVAEYDYAFRHYMEEKPYRSWAQTNLQLWATCLHEHVKNNNNSSSNSRSGKEKRDWRDICCWRYNRNACSKGSACRFEHRCSYCGSHNHIYINCAKRIKKSKDQRENSRRSSSSESRSPVKKEKRRRSSEAAEQPTD